MPSVQFFGEERVLEAADRIDCAAWAIFIAGKLFTKYEGNDKEESKRFLESALGLLSESETTAVYTLKFFEQTAKGIKINEKSVCDAGSFNFKLVDTSERKEQYIQNRNGVISSMYKEISGIKDEIRLLREEKESDEPDESIGSILLDHLRNPSQLIDLVNAIKGAFTIPGVTAPALPAAVGAVPGSYHSPVSDEQRLDRLAAAVDTLEKADPKLIEHLEKLAALSVNNKSTFDYIISMLDKMP